MLPNKQYAMSIVGQEPDSLDALARAVMKIIDIRAPVLGFAWDMIYGQVSNSHSCPESGKTNWAGRMEDVPTGYPGWRGRVWLRIKENKQTSFASDLFSRTLTYTGTGGGGAYDGPFRNVASAHWLRYGYKRPTNQYPEPLIYSYDYRFYDADWPLASNETGQQILADKLRNRVSRHRHRFEWQDPDTLARDLEFIAECEKLNAEK
jgi:hypothetical protein